MTLSESLPAFALLVGMRVHSTVPLRGLMRRTEPTRAWSTVSGPGKGKEVS